MLEVPVFKFALREDLNDTGDLFLPKQAEPQATGFDVRAAPKDRKDIIVKPGQYCKIPLGFRCLPPEGWWYELHPRSSSFAKKSLHALIGIVDESFPLEAQFLAQLIPDPVSLGNSLVIKFGEAIGQIIPIKRPIVKMEQISNEEIDTLLKNRAYERTSGFGSTGK